MGLIIGVLGILVYVTVLPANVIYCHRSPQLVYVQVLRCGTSHCMLHWLTVKLRVSTLVGTVLQQITTESGLFLSADVWVDAS